MEREAEYREKHSPVGRLTYGGVTVTVTIGDPDTWIRATAQHTVRLASQLTLRHGPLRRRLTQTRTLKWVRADDSTRRVRSTLANVTANAKPIDSVLALMYAPIYAYRIRRVAEMQIRIVDVDGTPEELLRIPKLVDLLGPRGNGKGPGAEGTKSQVGADVRDLIDKQTPQAARPRVEAVLERLLSLPGVDVQRGLSKKRADGMTRYVRFHRRPSQVGAFAYLKPRTLALDLRLPKKAVTNAQYARPRNVKATSVYQVRAPLTSDAALEEAIRLAEAAYKAAE